MARLQHLQSLRQVTIKVSGHCESHSVDHLLRIGLQHLPPGVNVALEVSDLHLELCEVSEYVRLVGLNLQCSFIALGGFGKVPFCFVDESVDVPAQRAVEGFGESEFD